MIFIAKATIAAVLFAGSLGLISTDTVEVNLEAASASCTVSSDCGEGYLCVKGNCVRKPRSPQT
jgi:hypothetical protein